MATIYLAAGLFNAGERLHNLTLEKYLQELGHTVILPQREALKFFDGSKFDIASIAHDCRASCIRKGPVFVGNADGADADSGTCIEFGMAIIAKGEAIVYRTDFRTAEDREVGVNAMLKERDTIFIYHPCYFTELNEVEPYYRELAQKIHEAILSL